MSRVATVLIRSLGVLSLLLAAGAWPSPAHGAGFLLFEQSGRAMGSAYAGEAAVAMDATTVYYNPAGMTLLPGPSLPARASRSGPTRTSRTGALI